MPPPDVRYLSASELHSKVVGDNVAGIRIPAHRFAIGFEIESKDRDKLDIPSLRSTRFTLGLSFALPVMLIGAGIHLSKHNFGLAALLFLSSLAAVAILAAQTADTEIRIVEPTALHIRKRHGIWNQKRILPRADIKEIIHRISFLDNADPFHSVEIVPLMGETQMFYNAGRSARNAQWALDALDAVLQKPVREIVDSRILDLLHDASPPPEHTILPQGLIESYTPSSEKYRHMTTQLPPEFAKEASTTGQGLLVTIPTEFSGTTNANALLFLPDKLVVMIWDSKIYLQNTISRVKMEGIVFDNPGGKNWGIKLELPGEVFPLLKNCYDFRSTKWLAETTRRWAKEGTIHNA